MNLVENEDVNGLDIFTADDLIFVAFPAPVAVFSMTPEQAIAFAEGIIQAAHGVMLADVTDGKVH